MVPCLASSQPCPEAQPLLATARTHLGIGNGLHWILDVVVWGTKATCKRVPRPATHACCNTWFTTCSSRTPPSSPAWPS